MMDVIDNHGNYDRLWRVMKAAAIILLLQMYYRGASFPRMPSTNHTGPLLLTWFNFNPSMDK